MAENTKLKAEQILLKQKLQNLLELQNEHKQLQALLKSIPETNTHTSLALLLGIMPDPYLQQIVINKGKHADVFVGQAVIDAYGIVGQVIAVEPLKSRVMLITSHNSSVPVQDSRSGARSIAVGDGVNKLILQGVTNTTNIKVGDLMITSGLGKRYAYGYPVGKVIAIDHGGSQFSQVILQPAARLHRSRLMLLLWPAGKHQTQQQTVTSKTTNRDH